MLCHPIKLTNRQLTHRASLVQGIASFYAPMITGFLTMLRSDCVVDQNTTYLSPRH